MTPRVSITEHISSPGLSLVELVVTTAVATILLAGAYSLTVMRPVARDKARINDLGSIALALDTYYTTCGRYPASLDPLSAEGCTGGKTFETFLSSPTQDPLGASYVYATGTPKAYVLRAQFESDHGLLTDDLDGTVNNGVTLDCSDSPDRYYCIGSIR